MDEQDIYQSSKQQIEESLQKKKSTYHFHLNKLHVLRGSRSESQLCTRTHANYNQQSISITSVKALKDIKF